MGETDRFLIIIGLLIIGLHPMMVYIALSGLGSAPKGAIYFNNGYSPLKKKYLSIEVQSIKNNNNTSIVSKIWAFCNTLRDDGVGYGDYWRSLLICCF